MKKILGEDPQTPSRRQKPSTLGPIFGLSVLKISQPPPTWVSGMPLHRYHVVFCVSQKTHSNPFSELGMSAQELEIVVHLA